MKIIDVQVLQLAGPELPKVMKPAWAPGSQWRRWGGTIVKVFTDEGITGLGSPGYNISPLIESWIKPQLIGQDPFALERHARIFRNAGAGWGVEIALWDIIGKACGQPLYKLWGGFRDRVPAYASCIEVGTAQQRGDDVLRLQADGWRAAKLRIHDWTLQADIAQIEGVRRAVGCGFHAARRCQSGAAARHTAARAWPGMELRARAEYRARVGTPRRLLARGAAGPLRLRQPDATRRGGRHTDRGWREQLRNARVSLADRAQLLRRTAARSDGRRNDVADPQSLRTGGNASQAVRSAPWWRWARVRGASAFVRGHPELPVRRGLPRPPGFSSDIFQWYSPSPSRSIPRTVAWHCRKNLAWASNSTRTRFGATLAH